MQTPSKRRYLSRIKHGFVLLLTLICLTSIGCSKLNCTRFENVLGEETDLIAFSYTIAEDLTNTASPPLLPNNLEKVVLVTTFVDNNELKKTSQFGRILQDHINSRLTQLGYGVKEIKLGSELLIEPRSGESILTREIDQLDASLTAQAIMVGTYSYVNKTMYISARLINPLNKTLISANDYQLCMDDSILAMFRLQHIENNDEISEPKRSFLNSILY